jgi:uncharacterized oligopeptide transporter (OPT) family protein
MLTPPITHRPYIAAGTLLPEMTLRAVLGGLLGILKYPEGTACAEVLKA